MREIKYRAWDVKRKTMQSNEDLVFYDQENTCLYSILTDSADEQLIFMQFTGLKDKNGKEIYEHDITIDKYKNKSVCCWIEEVAAFGFIPIQIYPDKSWHALFEEHGEDTFFRNDKPAIYHEIIGNIYENPELLEQHHD